MRNKSQATCDYHIHRIPREYLPNIIRGQSQAARGGMISIDGLTYCVWYTLIELCALGKFVQSFGILPKLEN